MKTLGNNNRRLLTLSTLFIAISALFISGAMEAWAMPGPMPALLNSGAPRATGSIQTITYTGGAFPFNQVGSIWVSEAGSAIGFGPQVLPYANLPCSNNSGGDGNPNTIDDNLFYGGVTTIWQLVDNNGAPVLVTLTSVADTISVTIGISGGAANEVIGGGTLVSGPTPFSWQVVQNEVLGDSIGDDTDDTVMDTLGGWNFSFCGNDGIDPNDPNDLDGDDGPSNQNNPWAVIIPVGGELIPINASALLVAGFMTNAFWMAPTIGVLAGTALTLYKFRRNI